MLSYTVFHWFSPVIQRGVRQQTLDKDEDLPPLGEGDRAHEVWAAFAPLVQRMGLGRQAQQQQEQQQPQPPSSLAEDGGTTPPPPRRKKRYWKGTRVTRLLFQLGRWAAVVQAFWQAVGSLAVFISPLALKEIVGFVSNYGTYVRRAFAVFVSVS